MTMQIPAVRPRVDRVDRLARRLQKPLLAFAVLVLGPMIGVAAGIIVGPLDAFQRYRDAIMGIDRNPAVSVIVVPASPLPVSPDVAASGSERRRTPARAVAPVPVTSGPERRVTVSATPQSPTTTAAASPTAEPTTEPVDTSSPDEPTRTKRPRGNDDQENDR